MKRCITVLMLFCMIISLPGCTTPVAGHPDELELIPQEDRAPMNIFDDIDNEPLEEEATEDIVDNPLTDEEIERSLAELQNQDPNMMNFDDGADAGEDYLEEEEPQPTIEPAAEKDPYYTKVDVTNQVVTVYGLDENGEYTRIVKQMICSTGKNATPTPLGVFSIPGPVVRWGYFPKYNVYAQYLIRIKGSILFHSVLYAKADLATLSVSSWYNLGKKASHGCVRMLPDDIKWLYENLKEGYIVEVYEGKKDAALTKSLLPPPPPPGNWSNPAPTPVPTETPLPEETEIIEETPVVEGEETPVVEGEETPVVDGMSDPGSTENIENPGNIEGDLNPDATVEPVQIPETTETTEPPQDQEIPVEAETPMVEPPNDVEETPATIPLPGAEEILLPGSEPVGEPIEQPAPPDEEAQQTEETVPTQEPEEIAAEVVPPTETAAPTQEPEQSNFGVGQEAETIPPTLPEKVLIEIETPQE